MNGSKYDLVKCVLVSSKLIFWIGIMQVNFTYFYLTSVVDYNFSTLDRRFKNGIEDEQIILSIVFIGYSYYSIKHL